MDELRLQTGYHDPGAMDQILVALQSLVTSYGMYMTGLLSDVKYPLLSSYDSLSGSSSSWHVFWTTMMYTQFVNALDSLRSFFSDMISIIHIRFIFIRLNMLFDHLHHFVLPFIPNIADSIIQVACCVFATLPSISIGYSQILYRGVYWIHPWRCIILTVLIIECLSKCVPLAHLSIFADRQMGAARARTTAVPNEWAPFFFACL